MKPSERWRSLVTYYAERAGLPPDLIFRQMMQESAGNPRAKSASGAMGLFQLMPATAAELHVTDPYDPDQNVSGGTRYDAQCLARVCTVLEVPYPEPIESGRSLDLYRFMLASYNSGPGYQLTGLRMLLADGGSPPTWTTLKATLPRATVRGRHCDIKQVSEYVDRILPTITN